MVTCPFLIPYVTEAGAVVAFVAALMAAIAVRELQLTAAARGWGLRRWRGALLPPVAARFGRG